MPLMDEFKEERAALKNGTLKEKFIYFCDYYKWQTIVVIALIFFVISLIYQYATQKDTAFTAVMMNASLMTDGTEYTQAFADYAEIDLNEYEIFFDNSVQIYEDSFMGDMNYTSLQKLTVYTAAGELDVMVTDTDSIRQYANSSVFCDLRNILTAEQITQYEPYFYYVDLKTVEEIQAANEAFDETFVPNYKDPRNPAEMEHPIPVGIYLNSSESLLENYAFRAEDVVIGIYVNSPHRDTAIKYIDFLMKDVK